MRQTLQWLRVEFLELWPVYLGIVGALMLGFVLWARWNRRGKPGKVGRTAKLKGKKAAERVNSPEAFEEHFRAARQRIQAAIQAPPDKESTKDGPRGKKTL